MLHAPPEKRTLLLDFETFSATPLAHGTHTYAADSEIMIATYAVDDEEEVSCIDTTAGESLAPLTVEIMRADRIVIHNSYFDRTVAAAHGIIIPPEKIIDTMVLALMHSLPGSLDKLSEIYKLGEDKAKIKDGKRLIHLFCKPRPKKQKLRRATRETHPEDWAKFIEYAKMDIVSMRAIYKKLPRWNFTKAERDLWLLDQKINDRGIYVDCELAKAALRTFDKQGLTLDKRANEMTEGLVTSLSQRDRVLDYLNRDPEAFFINDLKKGTIAELLKEEELPDDIREMLTLRLEGASTSPTKYTALLRSTSADSRLRGTTQFCGAARTGRWGGRIFQPHNLPRPKLKSGAIEIGIEAMKLGIEDLLFDNPTDLCVSAIRGVVQAAPRNKLAIADLSNIEGRVLAWLAGEEWKIQAFIDYDNGVGPDLYMATYARAFKVSIDKVLENEEHGDGKFRQIGKVLELACLGPNTLVLTDSGTKRIVDVTLADKLWDGVEWVAHQGLVSRGLKETIHIRGIEMTADHQVLCQKGWQLASQLASSESTLSQALATGSESLSSLAKSIHPPVTTRACSSFSAPAGGSPTKYGTTTFETENPNDATSAPRNNPGCGSRLFGNTLKSALMTGTAGGSLTAYPLRSGGAIESETEIIETTAGEVSVSATSGGRIRRRFCAMLCRLRAGMTHLWRWTAEIPMATTSPETYASYPKAITTETGVASTNYNDASSSLKPVYDLAHAGPRNRFTICSPTGEALIVHNCGFGGSVGAFASMGAIYGVKVPAEEALELVGAWRAAHPATTKFWYALSDAVWQCIEHPDDNTPVWKVRGIRIDRRKSWLRIQLPSGRYLCYPNIRIKPRRKVWTDTDGNETVEWRDTICYDGVDPFKKYWGTVETYYGKIVENIVQASSRDILAHGMKLAEAEGAEIVLHVHDEIIAEVPDSDNWPVRILEECMSRNPDWATGLPLAAKGFETYRYRKG